MRCSAIGLLIAVGLLAIVFEADAPLAPSKLPEGFSAEEVKYIPDPRAKAMKK